uniref:Thrombopoietin n=1 Tax=Salmo trutta TaxID=8032 RepID=A0A673YAU1_SALTR
MDSNTTMPFLKIQCEITLGLLLLLLLVVSSKVPNVQTRSIDFVGSDQLHSSLQLPCARILKASWDQKSQNLIDKFKRAEVRGALGVLLDSVGRMRTQTKLSCQLSLLERLEHGITNYLHIVTNLDITVRWSCPSQQSQSLTQVLQLYGRVLRGKLEWLSLDLRDTYVDQRE